MSENDPRAVSQLPRGRIESGAMSVVHRDGSTGAAMIEAGIAEADVFIAATGKDSLNGLAAQRAKTIFRVDQVLTAVKEESTRSLYDSLGIITIDKTSIASEQLAGLLPDRMPACPGGSEFGLSVAGLRLNPAHS